MELFGRGSESYRGERRRFVGGLVPHFNETLEIAKVSMPLPAVSRPEHGLREKRNAYAERLKILTGDALEANKVDVEMFATELGDLDKVQQSISAMRRDVATSNNFPRRVIRLGEMLQQNSASIEGYQQEHSADLALIDVVSAALKQQRAVWQTMFDVLHIEHVPNEQIRIMRYYINNLSTTDGLHERLRLLDHVINAFHVTTSESDWKIGEVIRPGSYQDVLSGSYEKLHQAVVQLREGQ